MGAKLPVLFKFLVVAGLAFGIVGGCLSIAGPILGLSTDASDLNQMNLLAIGPHLKDMLFYFDCGTLKDVTELTQALNNESIRIAEVPVRSSIGVYEDYCESGKMPHIFLGAFTGSLTIFSCVVFLVCMMYKRAEPELVFVIPIVLSIVMFYDFMVTNARVMAFTKDCTEYDMDQSELIDQLRNIVIFGNSLQRWGVIEDGDNVCNTTGACSMHYANQDILCTQYYDCSMDAQACVDIDIKENPDSSHIKTDDAMDSLAKDLMIWCLGAIFNLVGAGTLMMVSVYLKIFVNPQGVNPDQA